MLSLLRAQMLVVRAESITTTTVFRSTRSRTASSFSSGGFDTGTYYGLGTGPITGYSIYKWICLCLCWWVSIRSNHLGQEKKG
uniref:Uncharacterized protein n=1 Tax=Picea glauca TaxID=3330 RepID=A0A101M1Q9_PICGL|nr:hypothetical protein ABT39_MTgene3856 [Picea glauca]QHR86123.1 hypothetical protein Q903MT_gene122 [Picea sitchensis]